MGDDPYQQWAVYWAAGWRSVLPLPYGKKTFPPAGTTGYEGRVPSYADCMAWADGGPSNICVRMPDGVIGLDVDAYAGRVGGATLAELTENHGPLPASWLSTSRGDGISGIRLFRVPDGVRLVTKLPGIELVQPHHRYVVCWPSVHPEGGTYEWVNETTGAVGGVPSVDALPWLPVSWLEVLRVDRQASAKAELAEADVVALLTGMPDGEPCGHVMRGAGRVSLAGDRHDIYNEAVLAVVSAGRDGCPGALSVLNRLRVQFVSEVTASGTSGRRTPAEAAGEWHRNVVGAVRLVAERPQGTVCPDDYVAELVAASEPAPVAEAEASLYERAVLRKAAELRLLDDAREKLAEWKAGEVPSLEGVPLSLFLSQPDEVVAYRVAGLWPANGRVLCAAAAKAGKTTMLMNLTRCLVDGGQFLGVFDTVPVRDGRTVVYLNVEVSPGQIRRWLRRAGVQRVEAVHVVNLRGSVSALTIGTPAGRERVASWLRGLGAEVVILDPLMPLLASLGLDENSNSDIAQFFGYWSETLRIAGVSDDFIAHHAGHNSGRSRGASRLMDEPDALWTIQRDSAVDADEDDIYDGVEPRFFKATGRDVEVAEKPLIFDGVTGELSLGEGSRKLIRASAKDAAARARVLASLDAGGTSTRDLVKRNGNEPENERALKALHAEGVVARRDLGKGRGYVYWRVSEGVDSGGVSPVSKASPGDTATGGVSNPLGGRHLATGVGDSSDSGDGSGGVCQYCGGPTAKRGFVVCPDCDMARRRGVPGD